MRALTARAPASANRLPFDAQRAKADFPIFRQMVHGKPLVYLDSAATAQKPQSVIDAVSRFYSTHNANVHRGVHALSERATADFEEAREKVQRFIGAAEPSEVVFVRGTTEGINLIAQTFGRSRAASGDEVLISALEHHSNIVPWQLLCEQTGAVLRVAPINDAGELLLDRFESLLTPRTRLVALAHVSNALGTINPVRQVVEMAHARGVPVLIDGAQAVPHLSVDVRALDCDFYVFSGHKMFGPMGIGVLYGKRSLLEAMPPYQGGGDMILSVTFEKTLYNRVPYKFEAGTPDVAGAVGLGAAVDYLNGLGLDQVATHEHELLSYGAKVLSQIDGLKLIGTAREKASVLSFVLEEIHPHDIGTILDQEGIAIRSGHHCAQPLMRRFGVEATARASLALYNTREDIDRLAAGIAKVKEVFR
jgi:cysteine desulfurase/selenocysteine lyase